MSEKNAIRISDVDKVFNEERDDEVIALSNINLDIKEGEFNIASSYRGSSRTHARIS